MYMLAISMVTDRERNSRVLQGTCENERERGVSVSVDDQGISHWQIKKADILHT
jgi:hypothetical protein